jgi:membrane protein
MRVLIPFYDAYIRFLFDDGWAIASHIALSILMSLFPFLIFVTSLAAFAGAGDLADAAVRILFETWPEQVAAPLAGEVHNVLTQTRGGLLTLGVVLAIYFSSSAVEALRVGLNRSYDVDEKRSWYVMRLESIAFVLVGAVALLTLAFLVVFGPLLWAAVVRYVPALQPLEQLVTILRVTIATCILLVALIVIHVFLPGGRLPLRNMMPGILLTLLLWITASIAFGDYLAEFARNYVTTYAGLASAMIALVFLYMLAAIFIFGAELNAAIARPGIEAAKPAPRPRQPQSVISSDQKVL